MSSPTELPVVVLFLALRLDVVGEIVEGVRVGKGPGALIISSITVRTDYPHQHQSTARLEYTMPLGRKESVSLVAPWYPIMTSDDKQTLVGPRVTASRNSVPVTTQIPMPVKRQTAIKLIVTTRFPQDGGNCFASFSQEISLS